MEVPSFTIKKLYTSTKFLNNEKIIKTAKSTAQKNRYKDDDDEQKETNRKKN